jgi:hypothetical protein
MVPALASFPVPRLTLRAGVLLVLLVGCSSGKQRLATEQLVISDSVDRSVAKIDFEPLRGQKVYLDTKYMTVSRPQGFVGPEYVISSLRQQMMAHDLRLMEKPEEADIIVEARCGVLGNDGHDVSFGIPAGPQMVSTAAALSGYPMPPALPEISLAKRMDQMGATKVAVFAYDRQTKEPVWQSGIATSMTNAKDYWFLGVGPIQRGSVYGGTRFAGDPLKPFDPVALAKKLPDPVSVFRSEMQREQNQNPAPEIDSVVAPADYRQNPTASPPPPELQQPQAEQLKWAPLPPRQPNLPPSSSVTR